MATDHPLPSKALNDAFAEYEAHLNKTADKRMKGRQSAIRYNRRRFSHALKRFQNAKVTLTKNDAVPAAPSTVDAATEATSSSSLSLRFEDRAKSLRENCLQRLSLVVNETAKMRTMLSNSAAADERLQKIRQDPRRRKIDAGIDDIVKELDEIDNRCRRVKSSKT